MHSLKYNNVYVNNVKSYYKMGSAVEGQPNEQTVKVWPQAKVSTMVTSDWCEITGQIWNKTGITYESAQSILRDLSIWHTCAKFVPGILVDDYNTVRTALSNSLYDQNKKQASCHRSLLGINNINKPMILRKIVF